MEHTQQSHTRSHMCVTLVELRAHNSKLESRHRARRVDDDDVRCFVRTDRIVRVVPSHVSAPTVCLLGVWHEVLRLRLCLCCVIVPNTGWMRGRSLAGENTASMLDI